MAAAESNPLEFVDTLLLEEKQGTGLLGDTRFWQHYEYINSANIYNKRSIEYRTLKLMLMEAIFYLIFIFSVTSFLAELQRGDLYECKKQQLKYWGGCEHATSKMTGLPGYSQNCKIHKISSTDALMDWLINDLVQKAFTDRDSYPSIADAASVFELRETTMRWAPRYVGDTRTSILLGALRIRNLRVQVSKGCDLRETLKEVRPECYPPFSEAVQSKKNYAKKWTPEYTMPYFTWRPGNFTQQTWMYGEGADYPGSGFFLDLPLSVSESQRVLTDLKNWDWLNTRTRAVTIEFSVFNPNLNIIVTNRMLFEFLSTGGMAIRHDAFPFLAWEMALALMQDPETQEFTCFMYAAATIAIHLLLVFYIFYVMYRSGLNFFFYLWNIVDVGIVIVVFLVVCNKAIIYYLVAYQPNFDPEMMVDPEVFLPFADLIPLMRVEQGFLAIHGLLVWVRVLKYFTLIPCFQVHVRVLERCVVSLLQFLCVFLFIIRGFSIAFYLGFGGDYDLFESISSATFSLIFASAVGLNFEPIFAKGLMIGEVIFFLYLAIVWFFILNIFMAMLVDVYSTFRYEHERLRELNRNSEGTPMIVFIWTYYNALKGVKLVGHEPEENVGTKDEQSIALACLPKDVTKRFWDTQARMEAMFEEANNSLRSKKRMTYVLSRKNAPPQLTLENTKKVSRVQLQRLMHADPVLKSLLGTSRAIDVVRRFRVVAGEGDQYEIVSRLQALVAKKLNELTEGLNGMKLSFDEVEGLKTVSHELQGALTEVQRQWRQEITVLLQMSSLLSKSISKLTRILGKVQENHTDITHYGQNNLDVHL